MNKQYIFGLALASFLLANCKKENIETYNAGHYVQFTKLSSDTINLSFFFYPNVQSVDVDLPVKLIGKMSDQDLPYKLKVLADSTNATPDLYTIPDMFTFTKGQSQDTARITIKNRADLTTNTYKLTVQIAAAGDVQSGQAGYSRRVFMISNKVTKPAWWVGNVETLYLGKYTEKKFRAFMAVTGVGDINPYTDFEKRDLYLQFKHYLIEMKDAGTPVLEDDGTDMLSTVPLIG